MHLYEKEPKRDRAKPDFWRFIKVNSLYWKISLCVLVGGMTIGSSILVAMAVFKGEEPQDLTVTLKRPEPLERDANWLTDLNYCAPDTGRTIVDCYAQMKLWMQYVLSMVQGDEALRYRSKASAYMTNPKAQGCHNKPQQVCLRLFAQQIDRDLDLAFKTEENKRNAAIAGAIVQYLALSEARIGTPESSVAPIEALIKRIPEKFESDLALYYTTEGLNEKALDSLGNRYEYQIEAEDPILQEPPAPKQPAP
ncbi:hypothetical protein IQ249_21145, partial [Lusitaniella coriacea LEGE 07157]